MTAGLSKAGITSTYKYNDSEIRTEKTVNRITTKYHFVGDKVTYESNNSQAGQNGIYYAYDTSGELVSMSLSDTPDIISGDTEIGRFESGTQSANAKITTSKNPETKEDTTTVRLVGEAEIWFYDEENDEWYLYNSPEIPLAYTTPLNLEQNKRYVIEFDYWADKNNVPFSVDLYPDNLPQANLTATKQLQHYRWEFESSSANMQNAKLRLFGNKVYIPQNEYNIDITNIRMYELDDTKETYYYIRNGQGDIIGLIDSNGNQVVNYTYDTWGKVVSISGSLASTVGLRNPYRYRGYRYDEETGLYYLQSGYYNPEWGRFINADSVEILKNLADKLQLKNSDDIKSEQLLGYNMFAYCKNNPMIYTDSDGEFAFLIVIAVAVGIAILTTGCSGLNPTGPTSPGWTDEWKWQYPEGNSYAEPRWFDPNGGE